MNPSMDSSNVPTLTIGSMLILFPTAVGGA
jgi:hypothetical protein